MLFNSFAFMLFFAAVVAAYYLAPHRVRVAILLVASYYFYSALKLEYLLLLAAATLVAYGVAIGLESVSGRGRKLLLAVGVVLELGALFAFKYYNFFLSSLQPLASSVQALSSLLALPRLELVVPAGLSFYAFSCVSYLVDVFRGKMPAERNLGRLAVYVSFFPKLLAGPLERATNFLPQLQRPVSFDPEGVTQGLQLMLWGLFKKVVVADRLGVFVDAAYQNPSIQSPVALIIASYFYAFQIYCDFSGYSDIAIGAARVLGFNLMENFRRPYFSTSVPEFWAQRWHISLSRWFRDYMYIPMGGNRVSKPRWYFNLMAVFVVSGLWHGANWTFVIWGALNGLYQVVYLALTGVRERIFRRLVLPHWLAAGLNGLITFHLILVAWVFFRAPSFSHAWTVLERSWQAIPELGSLLRTYRFDSEFYLSVALIAGLLLLEGVDERRSLWERLRSQPMAVRWGFYYALILLLVVAGKWAMTQFVYMQF